MRYHSLRFVSLLYKIGGIVGGLLTLVLFFVTLVDGSTVQSLGFGNVAPFVLAFYILVAGMIASVTCYAFGAFIMLMIDVAQGIRNIDNAMNKTESPQ